MTDTVFICFSRKSSRLNNLKCDLQKFTRLNAIRYTINQFEDLILLLQSNPGSNSFSVIALDVENDLEFALNAFAEIRKFNKKAFILAIGEPIVLRELQQANRTDLSVYYLQEIYTFDCLALAVSSAETIINSIRKFDSPENTEKQIDEKVAESLQKLIDANMAKDQFLSIIAHDLKSPFQALLGVTDILLNDWDNMDDEHKLELIGDIRRTSCDTHKLLSNLLEWTKVQKEKLQISIDEVNVHALVESTLKISNNHARVKGIMVKNEISSQLKIQTDENMMATVFRNLISNAVQYTQPGGKINISAFETSDGCTFCVADNGQGIEKTHILDYFKKGSRKKLNGNATAFKGLGLLICKDFVEMNGGEIWLETEKGRGSKFYFTIPC